MELSILSPLILAFVQLFKEAGVPSRFAPVLAVAIGLGLSWAFNQDYLQGVIAGFVASGIWSSVKSTIGR